MGVISNMAGLTTAELVLALVDPRSLDDVVTGGAPSGSACFDRLDWAPVGALASLGERRVGRLQFGSEFCETLLPNRPAWRRATEAAAACGMALTLVTPIVSDAGLDRVRDLLSELAAGTEVVANDWGVLRLLRRERPDLVPVAGRMLCKMIKDPRLPSSEWARLYPHGIHSGPFQQVLSRLAVRRIEIDVPPFAGNGDFQASQFKQSIHAPYGFSVKGRSCRIGSLGQGEADKFATGHACRKECLTYVGALSRPELGGQDLATFQRGNTVFYRHSAAMTAAFDQALREGWIDRIVIAGDWHEAGCAL